MIAAVCSGVQSPLVQCHNVTLWAGAALQSGDFLSRFSAYIYIYNRLCVDIFIFQHGRFAAGGGGCSISFASVRHTTLVTLLVLRIKCIATGT